MQHPKALVRAVNWTRHGLRLVPRLVRLRHQKRRVAPPPPQRPYRRFFTRDHSFAELAKRRKR